MSRKRQTSRADRDVKPANVSIRVEPSASELHEIVKRARNLAPSTRDSYQRDLDRWLAFAGPEPSEWTPRRAQDFYDHLLDVENLRIQSVNKMLASLRYASKWRAIYAGKPELDFARVIQLERAHDFIDKHALTQDEATRLLTSIRHSAGSALDRVAALRDFAIVVTFLETGMRVGSLVSMTIEKTLLDQAQANSKRVPFPAAMVFMKGFGPTTMRVPLSDVACVAITPWVDWLAAQGVTQGPLLRAIGETISPQGRKLFTTSSTPITKDAINKMLNRRSETAEISHVYPHRFRHTLVTWRVLAGYQLPEISALTGHIIRGMDVIQGYIDDERLAEKMRNTTPDWLRELVLS